MRASIIISIVCLTGLGLAAEKCKHAATTLLTSGLAVYAPATSTPPTIGQSYEIKWQPTSGISEVSIQLLKGSASNNLLPRECIVESIPNSGSYVWNVPQTFEPHASGFGIQIIADGTGDFQYSMEFGLNACSGSACTTKSADHTGSHEHTGSHTRTDYPTSVPYGSSDYTSTHTKTHEEKTHTKTHTESETGKHTPSDYNVHHEHASSYISASENGTHHHPHTTSHHGLPSIVTGTGTGYGHLTHNRTHHAKATSKHHKTSTNSTTTTLSASSATTSNIRSTLTSVDVNTLTGSSPGAATVTAAISSQADFPTKSSAGGAQAVATARMVGAGIVAGVGALAGFVL